MLMQTDPTTARTRFADARGAIAFGLLIALTCWMSLQFTRHSNGLSTLWPASGLLTGALLTAQRRRWPEFIVWAFVANLLARFVHHNPISTSLVLALASTLEALAVAWMVERKAGKVVATAEITHVATVATASTVGACLISGLFSATALVALSRGTFWTLFGTWFVAHTLGIVIFATMTVVARSEGRRLFGRPGRRRELVLIIGLVAVTAGAVFSQTRYPLLFLVLPVLLLASFRHRFSGFVLGSSVTAVIAIIGTATGHGPLLIDAQTTSLERVFLLQLFIASTCVLTLPVAVVLTQRKMLQKKLADSENNYRLLAEYSRDLVVRLDATGHRKYISPSATEILGWNLDELREERWDLIHVDDRAPLMVAMSKLRVEGGSSTVVYRVKHRDGHYVWIEAHARLVPAGKPGEAPDIIYSGRDISRRVRAEQELARNQRRLRAITDNTPAIVIHINTDERYTFANAETGRMLGIHATALIGRSLKEVASEKIYAEIKPYVDAALRGETVQFESERDYHGGHQTYQCTYIPDRSPEGEIVGFYGMVFDISALKRAQEELTQLARHDSLTGLANRFQFKERIELAVARRQRYPAPIALLYLDIDHFKEINDTLGHAVGDSVLVAFAQRLRECVRETDLVARLGGDEFVVLIEDIDRPDIAELIARKLIARLAEGVVVNEAAIPITTSIGIAFRTHAPANGDQLMKMADDALYAAKAAGRNTYRLAD